MCMSQSREQIYRNMCLETEVINSIKLIKRGLCEIKNADICIYEDSIPFLMLSNGFERLMKCIVCLRYFHVNGTYPSLEFIKEFKHDISKLLNWIVNEAKKTGYDAKNPATKGDMEFLINDEHLQQVINLLSNFGMGARYYNLDIVTKGKSNYSNPGEMLNNLEKEIILHNEELKEIQAELSNSSNGDLNKKFNEKLNRELIIIFERFARALARLFTLWELGQFGGQMIGPISDFLFLTNDQLGEAKYCEKIK